MKKLLIIAGLVAASIFGSASVAGAAVSVCYDVSITANDTSQAAAECVAA